MKVLALTKYSYEGPSSRYRFYNYQKCFEQQNIQLTIKPLFSKNYFDASNKIMKLFVVFLSYVCRMIWIFRVLLNKRNYDLLLVEYELMPYFPVFFEYLFYKRGIKYIVDYDDAIFHKYDMHSNRLIHWFLKNKIARVIQYADTVIVCNPYLESYAKRYNTYIFRLPTVILLDRYKEEIATYQKNNDNVFVIGWIGSRTTSVYILELLPVIEKFIDKYDNIRVDLVGFDRKLLTKDEIVKYHLNIIDWSEEDEIGNILDFDIGIMPLHDDPWSKGKCGFKLVQYMSCKKPVIASPVGINNSLVKNGTNGFLAKSREEWLLAFETLYNDKALREKMAENNFIKVEQEYNHSMNCETYIGLIASVVNRKMNEKKC